MLLQRETLDSLGFAVEGVYLTTPLILTGNSKFVTIFGFEGY